LSIELYVFPTIDCKIAITELDKSVRSILGTRLNAETLPEQLVLGSSSSSELCFDGSFQITMGRSLFLYMWRNDENQLYFLEGHANNLSQFDLKTIANQNEAVGYHFNLDSKMGRTEDECFAMLAVAASLAKLTDGLVLLADHPFENVPRGGYRWNEIIDKIDSFDGSPIEPTIKRSLPFDTENGPH